MVRKILIFFFLLGSSCSDDLFSTDKYKFGNFFIEHFIEGPRSNYLCISKDTEINTLFCLPGISYVNECMSYLIIKNDIRGIEPRYFLCDPTDVSKVQPEYILILEVGDTCQMIRNLDSLTIVKKYPFVNLDMHAFF